MLDYLDLPIYDRAQIFEFLQHQYAYEAHVKKFTSTLEFIKNPQYGFPLRFSHYRAFGNLRLRYVSMPFMFTISSYGTEWRFIDGVRVGSISKGTYFSCTTAYFDFRFIDKILY